MLTKLNQDNTEKPLDAKKFLNCTTNAIFFAEINHFSVRHTVKNPFLEVFEVWRLIERRIVGSPLLYESDNLNVGLSHTQTHPA